MAFDATLQVRVAVVEALKASAAVTDIVGQRVYGPKPPADPTWPFVRVQPVSAVPMRATGLDGSRIAIQVSGFAKSTDEDDDETPAARLGEAISAALDGLSVALAETRRSARLTDISWTQTQVIQDPEEASGFHAIVAFEGTVAA